MRFEFHPETRTEYEEAGRYYERQQSDLDLRVIVCVEEVIEQILQDPRRWRLIDEDVRRCVKRVFPYALLYTVEPNFVLIIAVAHCSRAPNCWKRRRPGSR